MKVVCRTAGAPVPFLPVWGQDETVTRALDMGAADYVAGLSVDYAQRRVAVAREPVKLTATACCCN